MSESKATKAEKAKHWAKRLECPVDQDAGYHNTFVLSHQCYYDM